MLKIYKCACMRMCKCVYVCERREEKKPYVNLKRNVVNKK